MEDLRDCPICLETPEKEIYQCSEGHIICNLCIEKVTACPQCRTNYGAKRIRSRVLEVVLDEQMFECKFSEGGCRHLCQRSDISNHTNSCEFNSELIPLCEMFGDISCRFRIYGGGGTKFKRAEIISHFFEKHNCLCHHGEQFRMYWKSIQAGIKNSSLEHHVLTLNSLSNEDTSPLFIVGFKFDNKVEFFSFYCIQVWGTEKHKYKVKFSFVRGTPSTETETDVLPKKGSSSKQPPLICWTLNVCTPLEAGNMLKRGPIHLHIPTLTDMKFGDNPEDIIRFKISLIT